MAQTHGDAHATPSVRVVPFGVQNAHAVLRAATAADDKYSRGVVGLRTGSVTYPGAAVLGVEGAWRAGAGLVRYRGDASALVLARRPETVTTGERCDAWVIGSGQTIADAEAAGTTELLAGSVPVVADAGALELVAVPHAPTVMTPHAGEFARVARANEIGLTGDNAVDVATVSAALGAVIVLKRSRTLVAAPHRADDQAEVWSITVETPWLSTAGTGDVLAGMIGSVIAQRRPAGFDELALCAATAVFLHSRAGALAAAHGSVTPHPIVAMDVAEMVPMAVAEVLAGGAE